MTNEEAKLAITEAQRNQAMSAVAEAHGVIAVLREELEKLRKEKDNIVDMPEKAS